MSHWPPFCVRQRHYAMLMSYHILTFLPTFLSLMFNIWSVPPQGLPTIRFLTLVWKQEAGWSDLSWLNISCYTRSRWRPSFGLSFHLWSCSGRKRRRLHEATAHLATMSWPASPSPGSASLVSQRSVGILQAAGCVASLPHSQLGDWEWRCSSSFAILKSVMYAADQTYMKKKVEAESAQWGRKSEIAVGFKKGRFDWIVDHDVIFECLSTNAVIENKNRWIQKMK